ncbi:hypothetical protein HC256_005509 [Beauveria bassiana]|nr:hypothetical protein HC256_005509 [Beauveria bassiana]
MTRSIPNFDSSPSHLIFPLARSVEKLRTGAAQHAISRIVIGENVTTGSAAPRSREALEKIVSARLEKESSNEFGEPVFVSHYTNNGVFRHWVLHAHGHKYELRRKAPSVARIEWQGSTSLFASAEYYEPAVGVSGFCTELYKSSVLAAYSPEVGSYFYSMVGWTTLAEEDVERECWEVFQRFGNYGLFYNNCQHFLRALADKIVTTRAPDWQWLMKKSPSGYTYGFKYPLPYEAICAATAITRLKRARPHLSPEEQKEADKFIESLEDRVETVEQEMGDMTEDMAEDMTEDMAEDMTEDMAEDMTEDMAEDTAEDIMIMEVAGGMAEVMAEAEEAVHANQGNCI